MELKINSGDDENRKGEEQQSEGMIKEMESYEDYDGNDDDKTKKFQEQNTTRGNATTTLHRIMLPIWNPNSLAPARITHHLLMFIIYSCSSSTHVHHLLTFIIYSLTSLFTYSFTYPSDLISKCLLTRMFETPAKSLLHHPHSCQVRSFTRGLRNLLVIELMLMMMMVTMMMMMMMVRRRLVTRFMIDWGRHLFSFCRSLLGRTTELLDVLSEWQFELKFALRCQQLESQTCVREQRREGPSEFKRVLRSFLWVEMTKVGRCTTLFKLRVVMPTGWMPTKLPRVQRTRYSCSIGNCVRIILPIKSHFPSIAARIQIRKKKERRRRS